MRPAANPGPELQPLPAGNPHLVSATPGPDLDAAGYAESEWVFRGRATGYLATELPTDGRWVSAAADRAAFATRLIVRRPRDPSQFSGTVVVEWLNVSSGDEAAPDYRYLAAEILRRGHAWIGISAQYAGVVGGPATVNVPEAGAAPGGLVGADPQRYGDLVHPGDRYCYGIMTEVARAVRSPSTTGAPWADLVVRTLLAVGESQSAFALTTYCNAVQPWEHAFDGFLIHSRGGAALSLGRPGEPVDLNVDRLGPATRLRTDLTVPVLVVQTETDVLSPRLRFLPARQPDTTLLRTWEVAGSAHADLWQIGEFEPFLGAPDPVNRGQQGYVLRAALRALDRWAHSGEAPPSAEALQVVDERSFATDDLGNVLGGVRTPAVDVATQVLSGLSSPDAAPIVQLFGRTLPIPVTALVARYGTRAEYLAQYAAATDAGTVAGFLLAEDRDAILAEARPDLLPG